MYYAKELFVKRGPLATLWIAGSVLRKVTKQQVLQADVAKLCDAVSAPPVALALPTQSTLLRGVVRIENRKAIYLLEDAEHTTSRLTQPKERAETTLDPKKIKARPEAITFMDTDEAMLAEDHYPGLAGIDELDMGLDQGLALFDFDQSQKMMSDVEEKAYRGRPEDITLGSQDLGGIGFDESLEFGGIDADVNLGDFGEGGAPFEIDIGAVGGIPGVPPSPAISELAPVDLDLESYVVPARVKRKRREKAYVPIIDEVTEIDNQGWKKMLSDTTDLIVDRPLPPPPYTSTQPMRKVLQQPSSMNPIERPNIAPEIVEMMEYECRLKPIVDVAGHTPAEAEEMYGAEPAWELEETGFTGDISEGREREYEMMGAGFDESLMIPMEQAVGEEAAADGGLFAELSQIEEGRRRRSTLRPIELVSELETPDIGVPESQFEIPQEAPEREKLPRATIERRTVNKHTEIFRSELEKKFARLARAGAAMHIVFDDFLRELLGGAPNRRDRSLAFYQLLVLTSLEVIRLKQDSHFGDIIITKGIKYAVRWSSSQMFGSATPSRS